VKKIMRLRIRNFRKIADLEIEPGDASLVTIAGRNGQGKSTVIDSMALALLGGKAAKLTKRPIRDGEERASVEVDIGDGERVELAVTRKWNRKGTSLQVLDEDGVEVKKPQKILNKIVGPVSFDPVAFMALSGRKQVAALLEVVDLPFDPEEVEVCRVGLFGERTETKRGVKDLEARLGAMPRPERGLPAQIVSLNELLVELEEARAKHETSTTATLQASRAREHMNRCRADVRKAKDTVAAAIAAEEFAGKLFEIASKEHDDAFQAAEVASQDLPDVEAARERLSGVERTNTAIRQAEDYKAVAESLKRGRRKAEGLTDKLNQLEATKAKGLREAKMPITGLSFDFEGLVYKGVPFVDCAQSEQLTVCMGLAVARQPELCLLHVRNGALLDSEARALFEEVASRFGVTAWLEFVDESGAVGIVIEDGWAVSQDGEPLDADGVVRVGAGS